jgi:hypothetical protein
MDERAIENFITISFFAIVFLAVCAFAGRSLDFQRGCENRCAGSRAVTPIVDGSEACFCDVGFGIWERVDVNE